MSSVAIVVSKSNRLRNLKYIEGTFTMNNDYPSNGSSDYGYAVEAIDPNITWLWGSVTAGGVYHIVFDPVHNSMKVIVTATGVEYADAGSALDGIVVDFVALVDAG